MRKLTITITALLLVGSAFAHSGHVHKYLGTVTMLHGGAEFMLKTTDGKTVTIRTDRSTRFVRLDGKKARREDLKVGKRVVVEMTKSGKTAATVKLGKSK